MNTMLFRSINEPIRNDMTWKETWESEDKGLIKCWEIGREKALIDLKLAEIAKQDELPILPWKGGATKRTIATTKYGCLNYLAMWQGLRGEDLQIDPEKEVELTCSKTGMKVIYTNDLSKYKNP